jgi:hypothetical protein
MSERVSVQEGNFLTDNLGQDFDVALLINIVHGFSAEQNQGLVKRAADAVKPGGMVVILEQIAGKAPLPIAQTMNQLLGISFYHLLGGTIYHYDDLAGWLRAAGCGQVRRINLLIAPGSALVIGVKAGS